MTSINYSRISYDVIRKTYSREILNLIMTILKISSLYIPIILIQTCHINKFLRGQQILTSDNLYLHCM